MSKNLPKYSEPYWLDSINQKSFPKCSKDIKVDVAIIGGGITGITTAYLLEKEGFKVAVLEADKIFSGTTGHTTAKITVQHDLIYDELINNLGEERAKLYYESNNKALEFVRNTINENKIECDFVEQNAYIYANSDKYINKITKELDAYNKLGIKGEYLENLPISVKLKAALVVKNQGQFHPLKYLNNLVQYIEKENGIIYENTQAVDIENEGDLKVITKDGYKVTCENLVICTHFPFYDGMGYFARMYPERSYVLGAKINGEYPEGMYLSADDPTRSLRYTPLPNGEKLILIGGESHKTGQSKSTLDHYEALKNFGETIFNIKDIPYRWSTQDLITLDKVPYVGHINSKYNNIYVATGYRKWGMTNGTSAALLIKDMIMEKKNPYTELYTPSRFDADPDIKNFAIMNADVAKNLVKGKLDITLRRAEDLELDEGDIVLIKGMRAGAYKDPDGKLHIVNNTCTHLGCELQWNNGERTWDCPCHGSRFSIDGKVIEGPAQKPLEIIE
jgi:glycine/D-amino acid oxidase-like deaminating enzyme/nitrite reductase/ring-hydroxylating ferredoxin subunit